MFSQDVAVSALGFVSNIILVRWLGPVQLGLFYIINLIPSYGEKFGRLGAVDQAAIYFLQKKKYPSGELTGHLAWITLLFSLIPVVGYALFQSQFKAYFLKTDSIPDLYIWTVVWSVPFIFLFVSLNKVLIGLNQVHEYGFLQVFKSVLFILLSLFFWWKGEGLFGLCLATLLCAVVPALLNAFILKTDQFKFGPNRELLKDLFGTGWKMYLITLVLFIHLRADLLLVSFFLGPMEVAFYSLAITGAQFMWKVPNAITGLLYAKVSSEESVHASDLTAEASRSAFFFMLILGVIGMILIAPFVHIFYGRTFMPLVKPFFLLMPGVLSMGAAKLLTDHFYGLGKPELALKANCLCAPLNIVLNILLIPKFGISGAALVSSITYTVYLLFLAVAFKKETGRGFRDMFVVRRSDLLRFKLFLMPHL